LTGLAALAGDDSVGLVDEEASVPSAAAVAAAGAGKAVPTVAEADAELAV
jgi:hypothetical protein